MLLHVLFWFCFTGFIVGIWILTVKTLKDNKDEGERHGYALGAPSKSVTYDGHTLGLALGEINLQFDTDKIIVICNILSPADKVLSMLGLNVTDEDWLPVLGPKVLVINKVFSDGTISTSPNDMLVFYNAVPDLAALLKTRSEEQRVISEPATQVSTTLVFNCFRHSFKGFGDIVSAFGYRGDPGLAGVPDALEV